MKKIVIPVILVVALLCMGGYYLYHVYFPALVAHAFVTESMPGYVPKRIQTRIQAISVPINKGTEAMLQEMHASDISMEQIISVLDGIEEQKAYGMLDELNSKKAKTTNEVFNVARKHITADFDVEVFRKPFNDHVTMKQINVAIHYANQNRKTHDVDFVTAKAIIKKILLQKEKEFVQKSK